MSTEAKPNQPVVLIPKKCLSERSISELRKAGYIVVQATDTDQVKQFYPESFNAASNRAKLAAFEYALNQADLNITKANLRGWYIFFLKKASAF